MVDITETLDRLRALLGREVLYRGGKYRLTEVLDDVHMMILMPTGPKDAIMPDSYGHPAGRGPEFLEVPVFDENGNLSPEIRLVSLEEDPD